MVRVLWTRRRSDVAFLVLASTALALAIARPHAQAIPTAHSTAVRYDRADCPFDTRGTDTARLQCGYLSVPEDYTQSTNRTIRVAVAVIKAQAQTPKPDAVVFVSGGPGNSSLNAGFLQGAAALLAIDRDVVVFDQRGAGWSDPVLCPALAETMQNIWALDLSLEHARVMEDGALLACRDDLLQRGIAPGAYNSTTTAADLEHLRQALGYAPWNLFGVSYGSRLIQAALRDHPAGIRAAVLVSALPLWDHYALRVPFYRRSLELIFRGCEADAACRAQYPDLERRFYGAYQELRNKPLTVPVSARVSPTSAFTVNAADFVRLMHGLLYQDDLLGYVPAFITVFHERNAAAITPLLERRYGGPPAITLGAYFSVNCYDVHTPNSEQNWAKAAAASPSPLRDLGYEQRSCSSLHSARATERERTLVQSQVPALIASGAFDPVAPPELGDSVRKSFQAAHQLTVPTGSHNASRQHAVCFNQLMQQFLNNPTVRPDATCVTEDAAIRFSSSLPDWIKATPQGR